MTASPAVQGARPPALWTAALSAAVFAVSWALARGDGVSGLEEWVFRAFNDLPDWVERMAWPVMQVGALAAVPVVAVVVLVGWRRWRPAAAVATAGAAAWLLAKSVKEIVGRGRPQDLLADVNLRPEWEGLGFVSGHAAVAFAIATVVAPRLGRVGKTLVWTAAVGAGLARMYTAAHLPLDVVGGAALGAALGSVARLLLGDTRASQEDAA